MKKKTIYHSLLPGIMMLAAVLSSACTEDLNTEITTNLITFTVDDTHFSEEGTPTRGAKVSSVSSFGVSASIYSAASTYTSAGCGSYFFNESASAGVPVNYFWPISDYKLSFFAYYPYGNSAFTIQSAANVLGAPTYAYTVPSAIANQVDVMTAQNVNILGGGSSPVSLTFKHRCAAIRFSVTNDRSSAITLNSVSIEGVKYTGTLNEETWTLGSAVNSGSSNPFTLNYGSSIAASATTDVTGTTNIFLMLPQSIPDDAKIKVVVDGSEELEAELTGTWIAGKSYTYNLDLTESGMMIDEDSDVEDWEEINYLRFTALQDGTFTLTIPAAVETNYISSVSYSLDEGVTWTTTNNSSSAVVITTPTVTAGNSVLWKGVGISMSASNSDTSNSVFSSTGLFAASGNIMSLLYGDDFVGKQFNPVSNNIFTNLFKNCTTIITPPTLPATTLVNGCYQYMFYGCTALTTAPELPATTLATNCYGHMFHGCTSLTTPPELPATTLAENCYQYMFNGCASLSTAPELPATTLATNCYGNMFRYCPGLTTAPELPATTLENSCYQGMFYACTGLTTAPALPATTVVKSCYTGMFQNCTNLTAAPVLPATTLANNCYQNMFTGCYNLSYIKAAFTTKPTTTYTQSWVDGVKVSGTFVKNSSATWNVTGVNGIPSGWTVETSSEW